MVFDSFKIKADPTLREDVQGKAQSVYRKYFTVVAVHVIEEKRDLRRCWKKCVDNVHTNRL